MRASVHIDLPGWTAEGLSKLKSRCEELSLQPRGTRGESGGQTGCTYDISNKHRLGYSEVELVQTMIDGVNKLYQEDLELKQTHFPFPDIMSADSLVAKHMTEELWYQYAGLATDTTGFSLDKVHQTPLLVYFDITSLVRGCIQSTLQPCDISYFSGNVLCGFS